MGAISHTYHGDDRELTQPEREAAEAADKAIEAIGVIAHANDREQLARVVGAMKRAITATGVRARQDRERDKRLDAAFGLKG